MRLLRRWLMLGLLSAGAALGASPLAVRPLVPGAAGYGVGTSTWRFATDFSRDDPVRVEFCYQEEGSPARVVATLEIQPFNSSNPQNPELKILYHRFLVDGQKRVFLLAGYGLYSTSAVLDLPGLTSHPTTSSGTPRANAVGEITLLAYGGSGVRVEPSGVVSGGQGRLFFRCVSP
jgi:hypothetical protein